MIPRQIYRDRQIEIRVPLEQEADQLFSAIYSSRHEIGQWENWCTDSMTLKDTQRFLHDSEHKRHKGCEFNFNLFEIATGRVIGGAAINNISHENKIANVGYWIHSQFTGRSLAPLAVKYLSEFAFNRLSLTRLEIVMMEENHRSRRVAEKIGATAEGLHRNRLYYHGKPRHAWVFSIIPGDTLCLEYFGLQD